MMIKKNCTNFKNKTFTEIDRAGKYLDFFKLEDVAFISHLRMEGKYQICKRGYTF